MARVGITPPAPVLQGNGTSAAGFVSRVRSASRAASASRVAYPGSVPLCCVSPMPVSRVFPHAFLSRVFAGLKSSGGLTKSRRMGSRFGEKSSSRLRKFPPVAFTSPVVRDGSRSGVGRAGEACHAGSSHVSH